MRAAGPARAELAAGPPGGEPTKGATIWAVDLKTGTVEKA